MPDIVINEFDMRLINALQISPRASWSALAPILDSDATTVARRWKALQRSGVAWTSGYRADLRRSFGAIVEVDADPGKLQLVLKDLGLLAPAGTVDVVAAGASVVVTVIEQSQAALVDFLLNTLPTLPHIRDVRSHLVTNYLRTADQWTLRALDANVAGTIPPPPGPRARAPRTIAADLEEVIIGCLGRDARTSATEIARIAGVSQQRAQDAIATLLHDQGFKLRTDVVSSHSGWPVHVWYFLDVPAGYLNDFSRSMANLPEVRFAATIAGNGNLVLDVWLRNLAAIHQLEAGMQKALRGELRLRRQIVLRTAKRLGHLFDDDELNSGDYVTPTFA